MRKLRTDWAIYFVPSAKEKQFVERLTDAKIDCFFPTLELKKVSRGKIVAHSVPFVQGYVFVVLGKNGQAAVSEAVKERIWFKLLKVDGINPYLLTAHEIQKIRDAVLFAQEQMLSAKSTGSIAIGMTVAVDDKYRGGVYNKLRFVVLGVTRKHALVASAVGVVKIPLPFLREKRDTELRSPGRIGTAAR